MKSILFLLYRECTFLPPFMTILDSLCDDNCLKVISLESKTGKERLEQLYSGKNVQFLSNVTKEECNTFTQKVERKIRNVLNCQTAYHKEAIKLLSTTEYDLLWVIHEETMFEFRKELIGKKYVASFYELNDHRRDFLRIIKPVVQNAEEVLVPEYNRACILRTWLELKTTPTVIPNKPLYHPLRRNIENPFSSQLEGKKIILYQGYIQRSRNIDALCEACKDLPDYTIVAMGTGDQSYIDELKAKYPQLIHISFVTPPNHLYITSYAHIAIVKYDFVCLNGIFCAPNKTWEYTGFGIPVLCHNIPGLEYTIGRYGAGVCCDMDDKEAIKTAIKQIDKDYQEYSKNALVFYNSFDVKTAIEKIIARNI